MMSDNDLFVFLCHVMFCMFLTCLACEDTLCGPYYVLYVFDMFGL